MFQSMRDLTAGGTGTSTQTGSLTGTTTALGGGANSGLGSYGNYSGYTGNTASNGYAYSSYGGKSATNRFSVEYQPRKALQLAATIETDSSIGSYEYNTNRNSLSFSTSWQASRRMSLNATYSSQAVTYTNGYGATTSNTLMFYLQGHPFGGKLNTTLSWQSMQTASTVNFDATNTTTPDTNTNSSTDSLSLRLDYPISGRYSLFTELLQSSTAGYLASTDTDLSFGLDYAITHTFKFSLGWQFISRNNTDPTDAPYSYKVNSLLAQLGLNFN
jgi:hypothetical protein